MVEAEDGDPREAGAESHERGNGPAGIQEHGQEGDSRSIISAVSPLPSPQPSIDDALRASVLSSAVSATPPSPQSPSPLPSPLPSPSPSPSPASGAHLNLHRLRTIVREPGPAAVPCGNIDRNSVNTGRSLAMSELSKSQPPQQGRAQPSQGGREGALQALHALARSNRARGCGYAHVFARSASATDASSAPTGALSAGVVASRPEWRNH